MSMVEKEGVVKYSLDFTSKEITYEKEYTVLEECRERLYALGLIGAYDDGIGYGNISHRVENTDTFLITATQTGELNSLSTNEYSLVENIDFKSFKTTAIGMSRPSSECITHGAIYSLDKEINAVVHIHNEKLWNFMLKNNLLSTNDTPYGTPEMVEDVINIYKDIDVLSNNVFVMKGHFEGIVSFGKNIAEAEKAVYEIIKKFL